MPPKIFISYSSKDRAAAVYLHTELSRLGIDAFIDHERLKIGSDFYEELGGEILKRDFVIFLMSDESINSRWVKMELKFAHENDKPILPLSLNPQILKPPPGLLFLAGRHSPYFEQTPAGVALVCKALGLDSVSRQPAPVVAPESTLKPRSNVLDLLPSPFEWIDIPAGKVTIEEGEYLKEPQTFDVPAFTIAKYPITNAQFAKFIEAGGYTQERWWTDAGWAQRERDKWTQPRYWTKPKWNGAEHPVVGVSWYEAVAFCNWLSEALVGAALLPSEMEKPDTLLHAPTEIVTLPTEQQWQRAAQGDKRLTYPWGNEFDGTRCNTFESRIDSITPVTKYTGKGDSPFGVTDMGGNVWEWCLSAYYSGDIEIQGRNVRVLRGGSWYRNRGSARAAYRFRCFPDDWKNSIGFRVVLDTTST